MGERVGHEAETPTILRIGKRPLRAFAASWCVRINLGKEDVMS